MPNSIELKWVIQTSTVNSAPCVLALVLARLGTSAARGGARSTPARSSTSALASRAASAAAASASSSAVIVLLPSAMMRLLEKSAGHAGTGWRESNRATLASPLGQARVYVGPGGKKLCVLRVGVAAADASWV